MRNEHRSSIDYRRLARRNLPSVLRYKFLHEYGYDKGAVVAAAIVADICETIRRTTLGPATSKPASSPTLRRQSPSAEGGERRWPRRS